MDHKKILSEKINKLINGKYTVPQFEKEYYFYFIEKVPDEALTEEENLFFGEVQEKLDWTSEDPTEEEKKLGWMNHKEYVEWLKKKTDEFLKTN